MGQFILQVRYQHSILSDVSILASKADDPRAGATLGGGCNPGDDKFRSNWEDFENPMNGVGRM